MYVPTHHLHLPTLAPPPPSAPPPPPHRSAPHRTAQHRHTYSRTCFYSQHSTDILLTSHISHTHTLFCWVLGRWSISNLHTLPLLTNQPSNPPSLSLFFFLLVFPFPPFFPSLSFPSYSSIRFDWFASYDLGSFARFAPPPSASFFFLRW